jgi:hypothetical protein
MMLVGLGVDERARRIVNFLADAGIDIQLLTFHAFRSDGKLLLARQIESIAPATPRDRSTAQTKEGNRKLLHETAEELGVKDLLEEVAGFVDDRMPAYRWPGKTAYSFSLQERTTTGSPTFRTYVTLYLDRKEAGSLILILPPRAAKAAAEAVDEFCGQVQNAVRDKNRYSALEVRFTRDDWNSLSGHFDKLLASVVAGWKQRTSAIDETEGQS